MSKSPLYLVPGTTSKIKVMFPLSIFVDNFFASFSFEAPRTNLSRFVSVHVSESYVSTSLIRILDSLHFALEMFLDLNWDLRAN